MTVAIYKSNGKIQRERIQVKTFTDSNLMHRFLNKQSDNNWQINTGIVAGAPLPYKAGKYAYAGGAWHNVKSLDPSVLAHI